MFEEITKKIEQHLRSAFALLSADIVPKLDNKSKAQLQNSLRLAYENQDWEQVLTLLASHCDTSNFADRLLQEINAAEEALHRYTSLGMENALEHMSEHEIRVIGECLYAAAAGPFFPDYVFSTLFGLAREEVENVANE